MEVRLEVMNSAAAQAGKGTEALILGRAEEIDQRPSPPLRGKVALVTGSGRNIGAAIAGSLAERGGNVVVNVRSSLKQSRMVAQAINGLHVGRARLVVADVSNDAEASGLIREFASTYGGVDILVNNVGIPARSRIEVTNSAGWDLVLRRSFSSALYCIREAVPFMAAKGWGRIVNIGGQAGIRGTQYKGANAAAKTGLIGLRRAVANEWAVQGITSNHVGPGLISRSHESVYCRNEWDVLDPEFRKRWLEQIPIGRMGTVAGIAAACMFLIAEEVAYITGQTLLVDGGMLFV